MAQPKWLDKYLTMKPEVNKIYDDLEKYLDWCRFNLEPYIPSNLYKENTNWGRMRRETSRERPHYKHSYKRT